MKLAVSKLRLFVLSFLLIILFSNFNCGKEDKVEPAPADPNSGAPDVIPDANTTYIAYYAEEALTKSNDPRMMVVSAATISPITILVKGDTTSLNLIFSNYKLKNDKYRTNAWYICDNTYDEKGHDNIVIGSEWVGGQAGKLEQGRVYNSAGFSEGAGKLSYETSRGISSLQHFNASNKQVYRCDTYFGGEGEVIKDSYIKIDKIEDGKASGTFQLGFHAGCSMSNGFPYGNNVVGKFNKIAVN